jgi:sugar lactone lactonase YvrE
MKKWNTTPRPTLVLLLGYLCALGLAPMSMAKVVTTVAGGFVGDGGPATKASFQLPYTVVRDKSGNIYVAETYGHRIRKIATNGVISTYAGTGISGYSGDGGPATSAMVSYPVGVALDSSGAVVFADFGNNRVRRIDSSGKISTIAGNGTAGSSGDGGPATSASLHGPIWLAYDSTGNLYFSDILNNEVRKVDTTGTITRFAGNVSTPGFCGDGGPATSACLRSPRGLATDASGNVYISDSFNNRVRVVNSGGTINTFAGNGTYGDSGDGGQATNAEVGKPFGLSYQGGILYIANGAHSRVRGVTISTGVIEPFIGSTTGYDGDHHAPSATRLDLEGGIVALSSSSMLVLDRGNARLRQLSAGVVKTIGGGFIGDGNLGTAASFVVPEDIAFDSAGNLFVADSYGHRVRKVDTTGKISTVAGTGVSGYTGDGGAATSAKLYFPQAVAVNAAGDIFIIDQSDTLIRKVDKATGNISTFAKNANFGQLYGLALDGSGNLYAVDDLACVVWKFNSAGNATIVAGVASQCGYNGDSIKATTAWVIPSGLTFDSSGNMYIADLNNRIRKVSTLGIITTIAGNGNPCASPTDPCGDGTKATSAELNWPAAVAVSGSTVYIADEFDIRIRKVSSGIITTYAGTGIQGYNGDGLPALSTNFDDPVSLAVNPLTKVLYVGDDNEMRVREVH